MTHTAAPRADATWCELDEMVQALCRWANNMPWVRERSYGTRETFRLFIIDCEVLSCREPWFVLSEMSEMSGGAEAASDYFVVLPDPAFEKRSTSEAQAGSLEAATQLGLRPMEFPTSKEELCALQQILVSSYCNAFDPAH